jgi:hypothetical protein
MSRVGESSDDQRIREMQDLELRRKVEEKARVEKKSTSKAFDDVIRQKLSTKESQDHLKIQAESENAGARAQTKDAQAKLQEQAPKSAAEIARRAAMVKAMDHGLVKTRNVATEQVKSSETDRLQHMEVRGRDDKERVEKETRRDDLEEVRRDEEKSERRVDKDSGRGEGRADVSRERGTGAGSGGDRRQQAEAIAAASAARGANPSQLPPEMVERIAHSIAVAMARDGKTEIQIALKGDMLEGVTVKVASRKGKIHCAFEGCDKQTKNLIESSRGELMRALSKKGLELEILRVK